MRSCAPALALLLLAACQAPVGPNAREGAQRLPDTIAGYRRAAPPALMASNGALAGSFNTYQQPGGPGRGVVEVPEMPDPSGAPGPDSPGFGQAFNQALEGARLAAIARQAQVTVRNAATIRRDDEALLRCWTLETTDPGPPLIIAHCMGSVVDRYVQIVVRTADTPGEWRAAIDFATTALLALRRAPERGATPVAPPEGYRTLPGRRQAPISI
jgi:hypothetical protein